MAPTGPRPVTVTLNETDRRSLETLAVNEAATQRLRVRARIVLSAAEGLSNAEIAEMVGVSDTTVTTWRRRWVDDGMDGLAHRSPTAGPHKRLGRPLEPLVLDGESREVLERWTRRSTVSAGLS